MKLYFLFFLLFTFSYANSKFNMEIIDLIEYKVNNKNVVYKITAQSKTMNMQNLKKGLFILSKEDVVANNIFYTNGVFESKDMKINFKKAYFLEGNFVMLSAIGNYKDSDFDAQKVIYRSNRLDFENVYIKLGKKEWKKIKYTIDIEG